MPIKKLCQLKTPMDPDSMLNSNNFFVSSFNDVKIINEIIYRSIRYKKLCQLKTPMVS